MALGFGLTIFICMYCQHYLNLSHFQKSGTPDSRHGEEMQVDMGMDLSKRSARSSRNVSPMSEAAVPPSSAASEIESSAVNYPCHTCGEMFPSRSKQEQHIADYHSR